MKGGQTANKAKDENTDINMEANRANNKRANNNGTEC